MRKPLIALSLALSAGLGVIPVAQTFAATSAQPPPKSSPPSNSYSSKPSSVPLSNSVSGASVVAYALKFVGYPYTTVGNSPSTGFSCIGFASYVYRSLGIPLPGDLQDAMAYSPQISFSDLQPGDLLWFQNTVWTGLSHVAIYIGGGRFVHAEWYNRGVVVSSFNNDPVDGNYWIGKYLGASRPWGGAAGTVVLPSNPITIVPNPSVKAAPATVNNAPSASVTVPSLNVRVHPRTDSPVKAIIPAGTHVVIVGQSHGWYKVQLPDGRIGWIVAEGIGRGTPSVTSTTNVGTPTAPTRQGAPKVKRTRTTVSVQVTGLSVHTSPAAGAPVITLVGAGRYTVLARSNGWIEIRLPNGTVGWIQASYGTVHKPASVAKPAMPGTTAKAAMNVRRSPSLGSSVVTVLAPGSSYQIMGWSNGWAHVRLSSGATGWVSGTVIGTGSSTTYKSRSARPVKRASGSNAHTITTGVRIHSSPGVNAPVIGMAGAGTKVSVLGYRNGWTLVRLRDGTTGYVLGTYVR